MCRALLWYGPIHLSTCMCTYITDTYTYIHACIHTIDIHKTVHTKIQIYINRSIHPSSNTYIHTSIYSYIGTYKHAGTGAARPYHFKDIAQEDIQSHDSPNVKIKGSRSVSVSRPKSTSARQEKKVQGSTSAKKSADSSTKVIGSVAPTKPKEKSEKSKEVVPQLTGLGIPPPPKAKKGWGWVLEVVPAPPAPPAPPAQQGPDPLTNVCTQPPSSSRVRRNSSGPSNSKDVEDGQAQAEKVEEPQTAGTTTPAKEPKPTHDGSRPSRSSPDVADGSRKGASSTEHAPENQEVQESFTQSVGEVSPSAPVSKKYLRQQKLLQFNYHDVVGTTSSREVRRRSSLPPQEKAGQKSDTPEVKEAPAASKPKPKPKIKPPLKKRLKYIYTHDDYEVCRACGKSEPKVKCRLVAVVV